PGVPRPAACKGDPPGAGPSDPTDMPPFAGCEGGDSHESAVAGSMADSERSRALTGVASRTIEVVLRVAELGSSWASRFKGIVPKGIAGAFRIQDAVVLGALYGDAVRAASRCHGDRVPVPVRKFVALRARFHCEMPACDQPMAEIHHLEPRSAGGDHHPDNCLALCQLHHGLQHAEIFADARTGAVFRPGQRRCHQPADEAFLAARAQAVAG
ncbi:MAG: HNH endonuclease, partial [Cyanobacteria bacterium REEB65]|nr:HNH endonuclease [Cyanobacteria bacterium REEB65]